MNKIFPLIIISVAFLTMCKPKETTDIKFNNKFYQSKLDSINASNSEVANILRDTFISGNKKLSILIKDTIYSGKKLESLITAVKNSNFLAEKCIIEFWTNKKAYDIYNKYISTDIPNTKYIFVAEHLIATHYCFIPETVYNELMDDNYRKLGGKMKKLDLMDKKLHQTSICPIHSLANLDA